MKARWGHDTISLKTTGGPILVAADTYGGWAVHETPARLLSACSWGWTITHVPTGLAVTKGIDTKAKARRLCRAVAQIVGDAPVTKAGGMPKETRREVYTLLYEAQYPESRPAARAAVAGGGG